MVTWETLLICVSACGGYLVGKRFLFRRLSVSIGFLLRTVTAFLLLESLLLLCGVATGEVRHYLSLFSLSWFVTALVCFVADLEYQRKVVLQLMDEKQEEHMQCLRSHLGPHFLFNALNNLNYLVRRDAEGSQLFVHKLSEVYQYVLKNRTVAYVPLQEELNFCQDYFYLQKQRFKEAIRLKVEIKHLSLEEYVILPVSLQLLIENAIKHNQHHPLRPVEIIIRIHQDYVTVMNNKLPLVTRSVSFHTGLQNLNERCRAALKKNISVQNTENIFSVTLPIARKAPELTEVEGSLLINHF